MKTIPNDCFFAWVEQEIRCGRSVRFRMKGNSMLPLLREGKDEVLLSPCRAEDLKRWDVVLFRYKGRHILHRFIKKEKGRYLMQGDGIRTFHEECAGEEIIGIVKQVYRPSGKVVSVSSLRWRMESRLWRGLGPFRGIALKYRIEFI